MKRLADIPSVVRLRKAGVGTIDKLSESQAAKRLEAERDDQIGNEMTHRWM